MGSAPKQRISYFPLESMDDDMRREMDRCRREGTPRPESSAVRAQVLAAFWSFAAGTSASMAPGFESAEALARSKAASDYWAKSRAGHGGAGS